MPVKSALPDVHIPDQSLPELILERLQRYKDDVAIIDSSLGGRSVTFQELRRRIRCCAGFLHKQGLKKGDVVGLCAPTCIEFPIAMFGIMATGAVVTPCNPMFKEDEILRQFTTTEPRMVLLHESVVETMKTVAAEIFCIEKIFVIGKHDDMVTLDTMIQLEHEKDFPRDITCNVAEDVAVLPYSSGTTGMPKSVMLTHKSLVSTSLIFGATTGYDRNDCLYLDRPMFHMGGFGFTTFSLILGTKLVLEKEFHIDTMLSAIEQYQITRVLATPAMLIEMANAENVAKYDTSSLKQIQCGGASLSPSIMSTLMNLYNVEMMPLYGMTEFSPLAINNDAKRFLTSVGAVPPNTQFKIIDLITGKEVDVGKDGEILAKGPQIMKGYLKNPEETKNTIDKDGFIHTGDFGHFDEHGMLYVIDRLKEVIKYKTVQVSPAELESVILRHSKVADVGVIGIPDAYAGEVPKAFVVKKDLSLTQEEILQLVEDQLADFKQLRGGVEFVKEIPKSIHGKIQRNELKKIANI